ncbi:MAG: UDP-3-O-acyl-N-acetylglucosamine deacetylase, partial [Planctomycetota bacterium]|nr:UDP-3-O-acyl-N-acetylglucosamine deacetylase [Planctomycetota bacterium]
SRLQRGSLQDRTTFEIPNTDGSAGLFVNLLTLAGIREQPAPRRILKITDPISYKDGETQLTAEPSDKELLSIEYSFSHNAKIIGNQHFAIEITPESFISEIASARTFCMTAEVSHFQSLGYGKNTTYQNLLVVDNDRVIDNTLRFKDEFVRHKILDLLGDLCILNATIFGKVIAVKSGHQQNIRFVTELAKLL